MSSDYLKSLKDLHRFGLVKHIASLAIGRGRAAPRLPCHGPQTQKGSKGKMENRTTVRAQQSSHQRRDGEKG